MAVAPLWQGACAPADRNHLQFLSDVPGGQVQEYSFTPSRQVPRGHTGRRAQSSTLSSQCLPEANLAAADVASPRSTHCAPGAQTGGSSSPGASWSICCPCPGRTPEQRRGDQTEASTEAARGTCQPTARWARGGVLVQAHKLCRKYRLTPPSMRRAKRFACAAEFLSHEMAGPSSQMRKPRLKRVVHLPRFQLVKNK